MKKSKIKKYGWLAGLYTILGMGFYWWPIVRDAHLYVFGTGANSIKSYFTTIYYILYDKNVHFTGLNYPFGEHLAYVDAQPAISIFCSWLLNENHEYIGNIVAILNLLMLVSVPIGAIYLYRIFTLWKMPTSFSTIMAACITLLSPQILQTTQNFALSYVCFFPMIWFYSASWMQSKKWTSLLYLSLTSVFFSFIHANYIILTTIFLGLTFLFYTVYEIKIPFAKKKSIFLAIVAIFPLAIYYVWLQQTGAHAILDRPVRPNNFLDYATGFRDVFIPASGKIKEIFQVFLPFRETRPDIYAYVGTGAILSTLTGVWVLRDRITEKEFLPSGLGAFLMASIVCLAFSMWIPFRFIPESWMPNFFHVFQLNSEGAWVFYYVFSATSVWLLFILSEYLRKKSHSVTATTIIIFIVLIWVTEGLSLQKQQSNYIKSKGAIANDYLSFENNYAQLLEKIGQSPEYFQAILTFPYFNIGSQPFYIKRGTRSFYYASKLAIDMHLPIIQNYSNEISITETLKSIQLLSHPLIKKEILEDIKDERSILLVTIGNQFEDDEKYLIQQSRLLLSEKDLNLYDLPLSAFQQKNPNIDSLKSIYPIRKQDEIQYVGAPNSTFFWKQLNGIKINTSESILAEYKTGARKDTLEASLWIDIPKKNIGFPTIYADIYNKEDQLIQSYQSFPSSSTDIENNQVRTKILIPYKESQSYIIIRAKGRGQSFGSLFIRSASQDFWIETSEKQQFFNNFPIQ
ncbi:MAG: hypothetical protein M9958_06260 [Chitinophagales bacterium]|nr:hypothetical protein [Chitinophagales bacterium]